MVTEQYKAVYRLHTVVGGHRISNIKLKWENSIEWAAAECH